MKYIYENKSFPSFTWDDSIYLLLSNVLKCQSVYFTRLQILDEESNHQNILSSLSNELISSSKIEGVTINKSEVRSSLIKKLHIDKTSSKTSLHVDNLVEMTLDAFNIDVLLNEELLFKWHHQLFPTGFSGLKKIIVGSYRTENISVVSQKGNKEIVHYEGIDALKVNDSMTQFFTYINDEKIHPFIKAFTSQLYFLTIHPFDDGNGRIARNITNYLLSKSEGHYTKYISLSRQIELEKDDYYNILERTQKGSLDVTLYLNWFINCYKRAIEHSNKELDKIASKTLFWLVNKNVVFDKRQIKILNMLLDGFEGNLTTLKFAKIIKASHDTAIRLINDLIDKGILSKEGGGRNTHYTLK